MDAGLLVVGLRGTVYAVLLSAFGLAVFGMLPARPVERSIVTLLRLPALLAGLAALGLVASAVQIIAMASAMAGVAMLDLDRQTLIDLIAGSAVGYAWLARMAALALVGLAAIFLPRRPSLMLGLAVVSSGIAVATLAWTGHGAMDEGRLGWIHLGADVIHLLAAGGWLGAIAALLVLLRPSVAAGLPSLSLAHRGLERFSGMGTVLVGLILVTGIVNSWLIVGPAHIIDLPASLYGQLLLTKVVLFVAMLGLAGANRFKLVPALEAAIAAGDHRQALGAMRRSLMLECGCATVILALVAWLGTLEPPS
ncbi:copper homeostasis membrane protein CopD [Sphingomonas sp. PWP1-2]|uniref:copper homeostasis membrane protein CopD n=1 Tax=Sphingomonas sp. PWP1-2 TaxID=2804558 RepID=UPI003CE7302B